MPLPSNKRRVSCKALVFKKPLSDRSSSKVFQLIPIPFEISFQELSCFAVAFFNLGYDDKVSLIKKLLFKTITSRSNSLSIQISLILRRFSKIKLSNGSLDLLFCILFSEFMFVKLNFL